MLFFNAILTAETHQADYHTLCTEVCLDIVQLLQFEVSHKFLHGERIPFIRRSPSEQLAKRYTVLLAHHHLKIICKLKEKLQFLFKICFRNDIAYKHLEVVKVISSKLRNLVEQEVSNFSILDVFEELAVYPDDVVAALADNLLEEELPDVINVALIHPEGFNRLAANSLDVHLGQAEVFCI